MNKKAEAHERSLSALSAPRKVRVDDIVRRKGTNHESRVHDVSGGWAELDFPDGKSWVPCSTVDIITDEINKAFDSIVLGETT